MEDSHTIITTARSTSTISIYILSSTFEHVMIRPDTNVPQINFDMMIRMAHQHHAARNDSPLWSDTHNTPPADDVIISDAMDRGQINPHLTRSFLKKQSDWMVWSLSEIKQLNLCGDPVSRPHKCNVLPLIWTNLVTNYGTKKARYVCNGSPTRKGSVSLAYTKAATLGQLDARACWSITTINNYLACGSNATNEFGESPPPPNGPLYVNINAHFKAW